MQIRYAKKCDLDKIQELIEHQQQTTLEKRQLEQVFECMENDASYHVLIATQDKEVVGMGIGLMKYCLVQGEQMNVESTFVKYIEEGLNIKEKLINHLKQIANDNEAVFI